MRRRKTAKQTKTQQEIVGRVMREHKKGTLKSGSGKKVKSRRQAIAIGLSEAGASRSKTPAQNRKRRASARKRG